MTRFFTNLLLILLVGLTSGCAQQANLSGGEKDTKPPEPVAANPPNLSTNVNVKEFEIKFDEFIKLKNKRDNILINPPIENYEIYGRRRTVHIDIQDTLKPNVTYNIQFGESIVDITEGNAQKGFEYVFSTGDRLDSLTLQGKVQDAFTKDSVPGSKVLLYTKSTDSNILKKRPYYYAETNESGIFRFSHLKHGDYFIYALKDLNDDLVFNPGEKVGFFQNKLELDSNATIKPLNAYKEFLKKPAISNASMANRGKVRLSFNQPIDTLKLKMASKALDSLFWEKRKNGKEWLVWFEPVHKPEIALKGLLDFQFKDTAKLKRGEKYLGLKSEYDTSFKMEKLPKKIKPEKPLRIQFNNPVKNISKEKIKVFKDSTPVEINHTTISNPQRTVVDIEGNFRQDSFYRIRFDSNSFRDIYGNVSAKKEGDFKVYKSTDLGSIEIKLKKGDYQDDALIFFLLDNKGQPVRRREVSPKTNTLEIKQMKPGDYQLKVVVDKNGNGFWDKGKLLEKQLPERVIVFPGVIQMKPNWEIKDLEFPLR